MFANKQPAKSTPNPTVTTPPTGLNFGQIGTKPSQENQGEKKPTIPSSNLIQKPIEQKLTIPIVKPKAQNEGEPKPSSVPQKQNQPPKKSTTGGILSKGGANQERNTKSSLTVDTTMYFSLQELMDCLIKSKQLGSKQIEKIARNYRMYVKEEKQVQDLKLITKQVEIKSQTGVQKIRILDLHYLTEIEDKSKTLINLFFISIIQNLWRKLPFISSKGSLQILKLHISMNKDFYCQKGNTGTLDIKKFSDPTLYPITNDKTQINTGHQFYVKVLEEVEELIMDLFKGMNAVFKEISYMKNFQAIKYKAIFRLLEENVAESMEKKIDSKKKQTANNLLASFIDMLQTVSEDKFNTNITYFQCIAESIWHYYTVEQSQFSQTECIEFLKNLNQNYKLFNYSQRLKSSQNNKLITYVEKIAVSFLLNHPFNEKKWNNEITSLFFNSKLQMLQPFLFILPEGERQDRKVDLFALQLKGYHWKDLIDIVIKLNYKDATTIEFILNSITSILQENYKKFWEDPSRFENFFIFTSRLMDRKSSQFSLEQERIVFIKTLKIASSLMGKPLDDPSQGKQINLIGMQYPSTKELPFAMNVHNEFCEYFLKMQKKEFMEILCDEVRNLVVQSKERRRQQRYESVDEMRTGGEMIVKEYLLKLFLTEPSLLGDFRRYDQKIKVDELVEYLIVETIVDTSSPTSLFDIAFTAMDRMLLESNTAALIEYILGLNTHSQFTVTLSQRLFQNQKSLPFISRHFQVLLTLNQQSSDWAILLLQSFYQYSTIQQGGHYYSAKTEFTRSYYQLLSCIIGRLINRQSVQLTSRLRQYINAPFIIESLKYYLRFDLHKGGYVNVTVSEQNQNKIESLMECIRLYNAVLLYYLANKSSTTLVMQQPTYGRTSLTKKTDSKKGLVSPYEEKELGIQDKQYPTQVQSLISQTTTYVNALTFIIVNSTPQQKRLLKQVNFDYQELIFQTIETLVKLNPQQNMRKYFNIHKTNMPLSNLRQLNINTPQQKSYLNKFISYIENTLNQSGIELIIFGHLVEEPQRLRKLIDKIRNRLENPSIRQRIKPSLLLKTISTLSRYFRNSMNEMSLKKTKDTFESLEIKEHFEYLLQAIVEYTTSFKSTKKLAELNTVDNILSNLYAGLLTVHTFSRGQFFQWIKNYHPLLLNDINLRYLRNNQSTRQSGSSFTLGQEYFKLLQLFLNCQQYMSQRQFNIIVGVPTLSENLQNFIINIVKYSEFSKLPEQLTELLLQISAMSIELYVTVCKNKTYKTEVLSNVFDYLQAHKSTIRTNVNFIMLEMVLFNQLQMKYSSSQVAFDNVEIWPLQMNCIDGDLSLANIKKVIQSLKKSSLNNLAFVSICNGLFFLIEKSNKIEWSNSGLINELLSVYKYLSNLPEALTKLSQTVSTSSPQYSNYQSPVHIQNSPYKKVWILELLLAILTNVQTNPNDNSFLVEREVQRLLVEDEDLLRRFGLLMKKVALHETDAHLPWLAFLEDVIHQQIIPGSGITFAEKLQLYQILKLYNFAFAGLNWATPLSARYTQLVQVFICYRKVFERLALTANKQKPSTPQESILQTINLNSYISGYQTLSSGIKQFNKENIGSEVIKSENSFQLLHEMINLELSVQYATTCVSIALPFHISMYKQVPQLADITKWNVVLLQFAEVLTQKYIQVFTHSQQIKQILNQFAQSAYLASEFNVPLSTEMLFTNSTSLSSCLDVSYQSVMSLLVETLGLLFETIYGINKKLQGQLNTEYKVQAERFSKILINLKKHDTSSFDFALYDPEEQKKKMNQTIRSNLSRSFVNQSIRADSRTIRNF